MKSFFLAALLFAAPAQGAEILIPRATPEAVASAIIPRMLSTHWRLVAESPHLQTWDRVPPDAGGIILSLLAPLADGPNANAPIERVTFTIAAASGGTTVQSSWVTVFEPGSGAEHINTLTSGSYEARMQVFLESLKAQLNP